MLLFFCLSNRIWMYLEALVRKVFFLIGNMAVIFNLKDFFYPISIPKLRHLFEKTQWYSPEELKIYQGKRLKIILEHSYQHVPYYREQFKSNNLKPEDIGSLEDLRQLSLLTREKLHSNFENLKARNFTRFKPKLISTSGTSGQKVNFFLDRWTNVLEFVFYWRAFNWAGYRLGDLFAEFAVYFFRSRPKLIEETYFYQRSSRCLLLNGLLISPKNLEKYVDSICKYRPKFLKGLPSTLYYFSLLLRKFGITDLGIRAVFCSGEVLSPQQRKIIEETFQCKAFNLYGHMERAIAASECESGGLHINSDYGLMQTVDTQAESYTSTTQFKQTQEVRKVIATGLYNFSMPLIRYDVQDLIEFDRYRCPCGRSFPLIKQISGRVQDAILTPDGRIITSLFHILGYVAGIECGQFIQTDKDHLIVRLAKNHEYSLETESQLTNLIQIYTGDSMRLNFEYASRSDLFKTSNGKHKLVISKVPIEI